MITALAVTAFSVPSANAAHASSSFRAWEHTDRGGASIYPYIDEDADFRKRTLRCTVLVVCTNANDKISSVLIPAYSCVYLYEHINFGGKVVRLCGYNYSPFGADRFYNLTDYGFNDAASSSRIFGQMIQS